MKNIQTIKKEISVIVPVFNSYDGLLNTNEQLLKSLSSSFSSFEIIYILDGGTSQEWDQLLEIQSRHPQLVNIIRLNKNAGQHHATYCGLIHASGSFCVTIDDDLQFHPDQIHNLYLAIQEKQLDLIYGNYIQSNHQLWRRLSSSLLRQVAKVIVEEGFEKSTSFRIIRANLIEQLRSQFYSYIFIDEVLLQFTDQIGYLEVPHNSRVAGASNYTFWSLTRLALTIIIFHSSVAIKLVTRVGLLISVLVTLGIVSILLSSLIGWVPFDLSLFFNCTIVLLLALILFALGIIGEFVKKIYSFSSFQPSFVIREKIWAKEELQ